MQIFRLCLALLLPSDPTTLHRSTKYCRLIIHERSISPFCDLTNEKKEDFFNYQLVVRELRTNKENEMKDVFRRLNKYVVPLNQQELRKAIYTGHFINLAEQLTDHSYNFLIENKIISPGDIKRMRDIEFVSELLVVITDELLSSIVLAFIS